MQRFRLFFGTVHAGKRPEELFYYEKQNKILEGSVILFFDSLILGFVSYLTVKDWIKLDSEM